MDETLSASECGSDDHVDMDTCEVQAVGSSNPEYYGPDTKQQRDDRLNSKLKEKFDSLFTESNESGLNRQHLLQEHVIVDLKTLLALFEKKCSKHSCSGVCKVVNYKLSWGVLWVSWECSSNHHGYWVSSQVLCEKNGQEIYSTSLLLALGVIMCGKSLRQIDVV